MYFYRAYLCCLYTTVVDHYLVTLWFWVVLIPLVSKETRPPQYDHQINGFFWISRNPPWPHETAGWVTLRVPANHLPQPTQRRTEEPRNTHTIFWSLNRIEYIQKYRIKEQNGVFQHWNIFYLPFPCHMLSDMQGIFRCWWMLHFVFPLWIRRKLSEESLTKWQGTLSKMHQLSSINYTRAFARIFFWGTCL